MSDEVLNLTKRVEVIESRLGIDPVAIVADEQASLDAGAEAHVGNPTSDLAAPVEPGSVEDALAAASAAVDESDEEQALDHVNKALEKWPTDEDLLEAKAELDRDVAAKREAAAQDEAAAAAEAAANTPPTV